MKYITDTIDKSMWIVLRNFCIIFGISSAVVSVDKESCVVIMNKSDYQNKMQQMINDGNT